MSRRAYNDTFQTAKESLLKEARQRVKSLTDYSSVLTTYRQVDFSA